VSSRGPAEDFDSLILGRKGGKGKVYRQRRRTLTFLSFRKGRKGKREKRGGRRRSFLLNLPSKEKGGKEETHAIPLVLILRVFANASSLKKKKEREEGGEGRDMAR